MLGIVVLLILGFCVALSKGDVYVFSLKWGSEGSNHGQFNQAVGIAVDPEGNVYVSDSNNDCIQKFSSAGSFLSIWGQTGSGDGQFSSPSGTCVDEGGNVYVADMENNRVQIFSSSGSFIKSFGSQGNGYAQFGRPADVTVDKNGNIYVVEQDNARVQKFNSAAVYLQMWGSEGNSLGQFNHPDGIACDVDDNVYVADTSNDRIQKFSSEGTLITSWGSYGNGDGQFSLPSSISIDKNNHVFVADQFNSRIQEFDTDGTFLLSWGNFGTADTQFKDPLGVTAGNAGGIYVADTGNDRIQKFVIQSSSIPTPTSSQYPSGATTTTNSTIGDYSWLITVVTAAVIITFSIIGLGWLKWKTKKGIEPPQPLPPGWQYYTKPTTGEPPGTVFRITPDKKKFEVKQLDVKIVPCEESTGKFMKRTTMGVLTRFNGLSNIGLTGSAKKVQTVVFEMKDPTGETTFDDDVDKVLTEWIESQKLQLRPKDRYFIIRNSTKAKALNYQLTEDQVNLLEEKASLNANMFKQDTNLSSKEKAKYILSQEFNQPMRIMFNAEEIKMKSVNGKIKLHYYPVKGIIDWKE